MLAAVNCLPLRRRFLGTNYSIIMAQMDDLLKEWALQRHGRLMWKMWETEGKDYRPRGRILHGNGYSGGRLIQR